MKRFLAILLSAIFICSCFAACGKDKATDGNISGGDAVSENEDVKAEPAFSAFESIDFNNNKVDESIFTGNKLTVVNIWATFCSPCIGEMPDLEKISQKYADKGVKFIGICCDVTFDSQGKHNEEALAKANEILKETGVTYTNLLPSASLNEVKLNSVVSIPETIFIDENGNIIETFIGSNSYEVWCDRIDGALA